MTYTPIPRDDGTAYAPHPAAWQESALCAQADPELFFPEPEDHTTLRARAAKRVCARCPVQPECLDYALATGEKWGIWGGTTGAERLRMLHAADDTQEEAA